MIKVKFFGLTHLIAEKEVVLKAFNILDVLDQIKNDYPEFRERAFDPKTGRLYPEFMIVVNDKIEYDHTLKLKQGDVVKIIPIFSGG